MGSEEDSLIATMSMGGFSIGQEGFFQLLRQQVSLLVGQDGVSSACVLGWLNYSVNWKPLGLHDI